MKALQFKVSGNWGHFRKSETNNNPLSHDFITKTALIGLIGAVVGIERKEMKPLFPKLCDDLKYSVQINNAIQKQSWGFTYRSISDAFYQAPKQMEIIRNPDYTIVLGLANTNDSVSEFLFNEFEKNLKNELAQYTPVLGLHNCPAELTFEKTGQLIYQDSNEFETKGFITSTHKILEFKRIGFDKIPTFQNDDFWNIPERFIQVVYPSEDQSIVSSGEHYIFNNESQWFLI